MNSSKLKKLKKRLTPRQLLIREEHRLNRNVDREIHARRQEKREEVNNETV